MRQGTELVVADFLSKLHSVKLREAVASDPLLADLKSVTEAAFRIYADKLASSKAYATSAAQELRDATADKEAVIWLEQDRESSRLAKELENSVIALVAEAKNLSLKDKKSITTS